MNSRQSRFKVSNVPLLPMRVFAVACYNLFGFSTFNPLILAKSLSLLVMMV